MRALEMAISQGNANLSAYEMLPQVTANAGYTSRSNENGASSMSLATGKTSLETSTSQEKQHTTASLGITWNVLDFGVSYLQAHQQADRVLIAAEQRRKATQIIIQQLRRAWWRAQAALRLDAELQPLLLRAEKALAASRYVVDRGVQAPQEALEYQKSLLDTVRQIFAVDRDVLDAQSDLAQLLNMPPGRPLRLAPDSLSEVPQWSVKPEELEKLALLNRPELRQEDYQARIDVDETRKSILRLVPGIEFSETYSHDSNRFLLNQNWAEGGLRLIWNLMKLISGPESVRLSENKEEAGRLRRMALHIAIMGQVQVAWLRFGQSRQDYQLAADINAVEDSQYQIALAGSKAGSTSELEIIRRDANRLFARARRDLAYADLRTASDALHITAGDEPHLEDLQKTDIPQLTQRMTSTLAAWDRGEFGQAAATTNTSAPATPPPPPAASSSPATRSLAPLSPIPVSPVPPPAAIAAVPATDAPASNEPPSETDASPVPAVKSPAPPRVAKPKSSNWLQLGSLRTSDAAHRFWQQLSHSNSKLAKLGGPVVVQVELPERGVFFRLYVRGQKQELLALCQSLQSMIHACIVRPNGVR